MLELIKTEEIPLWERNHSYEKLCDEEKEDNPAYQLGYCMKKEVQDPSQSTYLGFSDEPYPLGNVEARDFDWLSGNPLVMTCDFNVNPMSWVLCQKQEDKYVILREIIGENVTTEHQAIEACRILGEEGHIFVELHGDGTSNQGGKSYGRSGKNDWMRVTEKLKEYGIRYTKKVGKSNPLRNDRVKEVWNVICRTVEEQEDRRLIIDPSCTTVIDDYKFSVRDGEELKKKKQGERGHISDAVDYWIYREEKGYNTRTLIK